jgi:hypothetical protein
MNERIAVRGTMGVVLVTLRRTFGKGRQRMSFHTHPDRTPHRSRVISTVEISTNKMRMVCPCTGSGSW